MNRDYAHIVHLVTQKPWAILPSVLVTIRGLVADRMRGERLSDEEITERLADARAQAGERPGEQRGAGVAVLPLYGVIVPKANLFTEMSGATSVQGFMRMFRSALADSEVKAIILDVDSPGGLTDLVPEAAAEIRAARGQKPIVAVANTLMASAAYWLASQADEVVASPSALVGSIGVYTAHDDLSAAYELMGIKTTLISAGKYKTEGNDLGPLDDEALRHIQALVDDAYGMFAGDVAKARGVGTDAVRNGFGQGRILTAKMAIAEGLVDRIDTLDATIKRMVWVAARQKPAQAFKALADRGSLEAQMFAADMGQIVQLADGSFEVPAGFTGNLPDAPESAYADDAQPIEPIEDASSGGTFAFEREKYARRSPA